MILSVITFFLGILSLEFFRTPPATLLLVLIACAALLLTILLRFSPRARKLKLGFIVSFLLGFLWMSWNIHGVVNQGIPSEIEAKPLEVVGIIADIPVVREGLSSFVFDLKQTSPKSLWPNPGRVKVRWKNAPQSLEVGDEWRFSIKLKRPHGYANPGSFDKERQFFQQRWVAEGVVIPKLPYTKIASTFWSHPLDRIRASLSADIQAALQKRPFAGIIQALVVGIQSDIYPEHWQVFRNTGTAHLVAISGLHVGLVSGFAFAVVCLIWRWMPLRFLWIPAPLVAAVGGLLAALVYALLAGFSIPTQRAVVMIAIFMSSIFRKRLSALWRNYFLALGIVLLWDPFSTLSAGFWLSFGAVGIILYGMQGRLKPTGIWWKFGRAQWLVFLGLAPLSFALFGMSSLVSPFANLIAIPWVSFLVVPLSLVGAFSSAINTRVGAFFLKSAENLMSLLWPILQVLSEWQHATWMNTTQGLGVLLLALVGVLLLLSPRGFPGKYLGIIGILPLFLIKPMGVEPHTALVTVLDVGQGLSTVVETAHHVLVFDTGPRLGPGVDTGDRVVVPFLGTRAKRVIDALVISHGDNDHAGGAKSILEQMQVKNIISSEPSLFPEREVISCYAGQHWEWDGVLFEILHPSTQFTKKRNDYSCVLRVQAGSESVLLTADIEAKSEYLMLARAPEKLASTVLLVPHHGSRTSSTPEFIRAVHPQVAIIPVGYRNQYGHPKPDIVERYNQAGIPILNSVRDGAVSFILNDKSKNSTWASTETDPHRSDIQSGIAMKRYRIDNQHYWNFMN